MLEVVVPGLQPAFEGCVVKNMFGGCGAGKFIRAGGASWPPSTIIGPGVAYGTIVGAGAGHGCGIETMMDCGGPEGTMTGGGLGGRLGRQIYIGPVDGPGTITCRVGAGNGGSSAYRVFDGQPGGEQPDGGHPDGGHPDGGQPEGVGSRPEAERVLSSGFHADGGTDERDDGQVVDAAESNTRRATGESSLMMRGDDVTECSRVAAVCGGRVPKSCGVADSALMTGTSAAGGRELSVAGEHRADSREATSG